MNFKRLLTFLLVVQKLTCVGQDMHWSQFNEIPLYQNPAFTGHFNGDYRFVANYRNQWKSVTVPFSTFSFSVDAPLKKNNKIGTGLLFLHDVTGDGKLKTIDLLGSLSYRFKLLADSTKTIRLGMTLGLNHRQINWNQLYFDSQFNGYTFDSSLPTNETFQTDRKTTMTLGLGMIYAQQISKYTKITCGVGLFNLNRPNQGFYTQKIQRDIRVNFFGKGDIKLDPDWNIIPSVNLSFQGKYKELIIGSSLKYTFIHKTGMYKALYSGLWYRSLDAAFLTFGLDYNDWFVGVSYDINFSSLVPASNHRGGFEIATRYILNYFKPQKIMHRVCPDFI